MMLPVETLKLIQETAREAQKATVIRELTNARKAYVQHGDRIELVDLAPPLRSHAVESLQSLIDYVLRPDNPAPVVWHGDAAVVCLPDDEDRRDLVHFSLTHSERFACLADLAKRPGPMTQQQFVRLLRVHLRVDAAVVAKFRKLDWSVGNTGVADLRNANLRVDKSLVAKVQGVDELPEEMTIMVPVYNEPGEREEYLVPCYLEVDPVNQSFTFGPMPDELERVVDLAQQSIRQRLDEALAADPQDERKAIPIYYGTP